MRATGPAVFVSVVLCVPSGAEPAQADPRKADPLAAEIDRWSPAPALAGALEALGQGRRLLALHRFARAHEDLAATRYVASQSASDRQSLAAFEAEWQRRQAAMTAPAIGNDVGPALLRAEAEAAAAQAPVYARASLDYARSTTAEAGYYYLGAADAAHGFAGIARRLSWDAPGSAPLLRDLQPDIDALRGRLLAAYRPPTSLERHPEFIAASAMLKEAAELNAAGRRHGALLRYLEAARRTGPLAPAPAPLAFSHWEARLADPSADHSIGRLFLEMAQAAPEADRAALAAHVLPLYFAALAPAAASPARSPAVTVTLVRWPYT